MTVAARLTLARWLSPAFPLGSFAYSHGLETAMAEGRVATAAQVGDWVSDVVRFGSAWVDAVVLAQALRSGADHADLSDLARAMAASRERWQETSDQGAAFVRTVNAVTGQSLAPAPLPVAVGRAAAGLGLPPDEVVALYLNAFATALVQAAVRFIPLGQTEGQAVLARLAGYIADVAGRAVSADMADVVSSGFGADLSAMEHETLQPRIFVT
jgi:urease accessory protein